MDGRRIAMNLSVYHSKYWEQLLNSSNHSDDTSNGGPDCSKTKRVEPPTDTDGKFVEIHLLNDYTGTKTKEELQIYETEHRLPEIRVCPAVHGGALENPKVVTASIGNVLEKWEFCYQQLQRKIKAQNPVNEPKKEKLLALYRCTSMENLTVRAQEEDLDVPGFIATIRECSEKVYLYALDLSRHLLEKGKNIEIRLIENGFTGL